MNYSIAESNIIQVDKDQIEILAKKVFILGGFPQTNKKTQQMWKKIWHPLSNKT